MDSRAFQRGGRSRWAKTLPLVLAAALAFPAVGQTPTGKKLSPLSATANDVYPGHAVTNLLDGNLETKWAGRADGKGKNTVVFDFGGVVALNEIIVYHAEAGGEGINLNTEDFHVETGPTSAGPWTLLFQVVDNLGDRSARSFPPVRTRYVRLVIDDAMSMNEIGARNDDNIARIPEVEFFGPPGSVPAGGATPHPTPKAAGEPPPFLRISGGQVPSAVAMNPAVPAASAGAIPAARGVAPPFSTPAPVAAGVAAGANPALPSPPRGAPAASPAASTASAWLTDIAEAGRSAKLLNKTIIVYFRSDASKWQSAADAVLLDPALASLLQKNNILLVLDLKARPQDGAKFAVVRAPTLAQWTAAGKELQRLWGGEITRQNIVARFRL